LEKISRILARYLSRERHVHGATPPTPPDRLVSCLEPADVLLVEGNSQISTAIKYLTQSTWSRAALYVGAHRDGRLAQPMHCFIEADLMEGVRSVGIEAFAGKATRICRPVGLTDENAAPSPVLRSRASGIATISRMSLISRVTCYLPRLCLPDFAAA
jgi:hypothetical protein